MLVLTAFHYRNAQGEILDLLWSDVDLRNRILTVRESKSGKSRRIPIDNTLAAALRRLPSRFKKGDVFPSPKTGRRWVDFKKGFHVAVRKAGIEDFRFHDTRHTFASHLVMAGVDIKSVQELLGHSSLSMTMRYAHLALPHRTRAIEALDDALRTDTRTDTVEQLGKQGSR